MRAGSGRGRTVAGYDAGVVAAPSAPGTPDLILFDGECNVCNRWVWFVLRRDPRGRYCFAALRSDAARVALERAGYAGTPPESVGLIRGSRVWFKTAAVLRIARHLRWPWPLTAALLLVPPPLRDLCYDAFAARRYRWFGRAERCLVPTAELRARFLDADDRESVGT
ncbi:MAG: DUF393 domain-containing protein [Planctomycetes bacterium]|nr:DUF393 domain-containing protein [Planctomycetota bacterium]